MDFTWWLFSTPDGRFLLALAVAGVLLTVVWAPLLPESFGQLAISLASLALTLLGYATTGWDSWLPTLGVQTAALLWLAATEWEIRSLWKRIGAKE